MRADYWNERDAGIHGLKCKSETNDAQAAVLLDSSNNSIEDVNIVGFYDGILVGSQASAQSNGGWPGLSRSLRRPGLFSLTAKMQESVLM